MITRTVRKLIIPLLLVVGVQVWLLFDTTLHDNQLVVLLLALVLALIPAVNRRVFYGVRRLRRVSPRTQALTTLAIFVLSGAYLSFTAIRQGRDLFPKYHDNQSYALQALIIASGKLWLPAHAHPDFFDTFHVIVEPVYASMYFPGAAMLYALGVLAGLPFWIIAIIIAAGGTAMLYRVITDMVDPFAGLLAVFWLLSLIWFRHLSTALMSHTVLMLMGLAMLWCYLRWKRGLRWRWALLIGAIAGWAAITRPADALCYALPIGIAMLLDLRAAARRFGDFARLVGTIVAGAAPFLIIQVIFNLGVTGKPFESPYRFYLDRYAPQLSFGFHEYDPTQVVQSPVRQKQVYHEAFNVKLIKDHRPETLFTTWFDPSVGRLRIILESTTPSLILAPVLLVGLLGLTSRPRWALFLVLPLYCLLYMFYAALLRHYTPAIAPATILLGVLGVREMEAAWPRFRAAVTTLTVLIVAGVSLLLFPEMSLHRRDDIYPYPETTDARQNIPNNPGLQRPALVFVTFNTGGNVHSEPVYNIEKARIDENSIVFAHDLGAERNVELLRYYAQLQPERHVYRYDRGTRRLIYRGTVGEDLQQVLQNIGASPATAPANR